MDTTRTPLDIASDLIDGALTNGGATVWVSEVADHGFLVGLPGRGCTFTRDERHRDPKSVRRQAVAWVKGTGRTVEVAATWGSWIDADTGTLYLDLCSHHAELTTALTVAENRGELAVWDVEHGREVRVADPTDTCEASDPEFVDGRCLTCGESVARH